MWKMRRLGELNERVHGYRLNPKGFDMRYQDYNINLWIRDLKNLYFEIYPKLSTKERNDIEKIKSAIETALSNYPVMETNKNRKVIWNESICKVYVKYLEILEKLLLLGADVHGLDSPTKGESSMF